MGARSDRRQHASSGPVEGPDEGPRYWPRVKPELENLLNVRLPESLLGEGEPLDDAQSVTGLLREVLKRGLVPTGSRISGESLAAIFDLHRNTISKVFQNLADEGLLHRRQGRSPRVAALRAPVVKRQTRRVSHTELAREYHLEVRSQAVSTDRMRIAQLDEGRRRRVAERLELDEMDEVVVHARIREIREPDGIWVPAIAEVAYFAAQRASSLVEAIAAGRVNSILEFLTQSGIDPITGAYEVRASTLPEAFHRAWATRAKLGVDAVATLPFLHFESTTQSGGGAIEFSVAYLHKAFFSLATTDVVLRIKTSGVIDEARRIGRTSDGGDLRLTSARRVRRPARRRAAR